MKEPKIDFICIFMCLFKCEFFEVSNEQTSHFLFFSDGTLSALLLLTGLNFGQSELERVSIAGLTD